MTEAWDAYSFLTWMEQQSQSVASQFDYQNMGTLSDFLSDFWRSDRFILAAARKDNTISGFSYNRFYDEIYCEPNLDRRDQLRDEKRLTEMDNKRAQLNNLGNYGYFAPGYRPLLGGHVLTVPLVEDSTKNEDDGKDIRDAIASLMSSSGNVLQSWEGDYGLWLDQNGRYNDCLNYFFDITDMDKKGGDVYIPDASTEGNDLGNAIELLAIEDPNTQQETQISLDKVIRLFSYVTSQTGDDTLGLRVGQNILPGSLNALGYALMSSKNLYEALCLQKNFGGAISNCAELGISIDDIFVHVSFTIADHNPELLRPIHDMFLSMFWTYANWITRTSGRLSQVCFTHPQPEYHAAYREVFGVQPLFGQDSCCLVFEKKISGRSFVSG